MNPSILSSILRKPNLLFPGLVELLGRMNLH